MINKKSISLIQIFILVFGIVAIGYAIGSEIKIVSSALNPTSLPIGAHVEQSKISGTLVQATTKVPIDGKTTGLFMSPQFLQSLSPLELPEDHWIKYLF